ncbi:phage tail tape measure protein [Halococcus hamelinensis]|uniref:Phage tail tape measure protein domain-containing protein n=3 Tax=Halococcus hamelinensis TaxID=332168 RepID=M0M253_9EURY|nr:phage tail tape measure protein [Halococcus hamelinensis]EMA38475.1 hypothetical protein C447_09982 [Halococcus hamelinensis 100A6]
MALFDNLESSLKLDASDYVREADKAERASKDVADATESMGDAAGNSAGGADRAKQAVGGLAAGASALAAGGLAKSIQAATSFESSMADVEKVTSKGIAEKLKGNFQSLAEEIPISQQELATLGEQAGKFGVKGAKNITKFVETVGQISSATDLAAGEAGTRFAKIAGAIGLPMGQIGKLGNATNSLADSMKTDAGEITDTANRAGITLSKRLGLSKQSVLGLSASMNEVSPSAQLAASGLKQAAEALLDPKKVGKIASALGMTKSEFIQLRDQSPQKAFDLVSKAMAKGGDRATALAKAVGKRPTRAFSALGQQVGRTHQAMKTASGQFKNGTSLAREMSIRTGTAAGKWQLFKNKLQNVAITTGDALLPVLLRVLDPISNAISLFGEWNSKLGGIPAVVALVATAIGGLAVAAGVFIGPLTTGVTMMGALAGAASALLSPLALIGTALGALLSPIGIVIAGVAALGAAFATDFGGIRTMAMQLVGILRGQFLTIWTQLKATILPILSQIAAAWDGQGSRVQSVASTLIENIGGRLVPIILRFGAMARRAIASVASFWNTHGSTILSIVRLLSTNLSEMLIQAMAAVSSALQGDFVQMRGAFQEFKTAALNIWNAIWPRLKQAAMAGLRMAWNWVKGPGVSLAKQALSFLATAAVAAFNFGKQHILPAVQSALRFAWNWVKGPGVQLAKQALSLLARGAVAAFKFGKQNLLPVVQRAIRFAWNWVKTSGVSLAKQALAFLGRQAIAAFTFAKENILPKVQTALTAAWTWLRTSGVQLGRQALTFLGNQAIAAFTFAKNKIVPKVSKALGAAWTWLRTTGLQKGKQALIFLGNQTIAAFSFAKKKIVPKVSKAIGAGWQWLRTKGLQKGKQALIFLGNQAINAFTFAKNKIVPKVSGAIGAAWTWLRTTGLQKGKQALGFLANQAVNAFDLGSGGGSGGGGGGGLQGKAASALSGVGAWLRNQGVSILRGALSFLVTQGANALSALQQAGRRVVSQAIAAISTYLRTQATTDVKNAFKAIGRGIRAVLVGLFNVGKGIGRIVRQGIGAIVSYLRNQAWSDLKGAAEFLFGAAVTAAKGLFALGKGIGQAIRTGMGAIFSYLRNQAWSDLKGAAEFLFGAAKVAAEALFNVGKGIGGVIKDFMGAIVSYLRTQAWSDLKGAAEFLFDAVMAAAEGLYQGLIGNSLIPEMFGEIASFIRNFNLFAPVDALLSSAWQRFDKFKTDAFNTVSNLLGEVVTAIQSWSLLQKVNSALKSVWLRFDKFKTDAVNTIKQTVSDILSAVSPRNLKSKLKSKIGGALDGAKEKFKSLYNDVVGNSIVPDMASDVVGVMDKMDMAGPAGREMGRAFDQFAWLQTNAKKRTDKLNRETLNNIKAMASATSSRAKSWVGSFVKPFGQAKDRVSGLFSDLHHMVVGGSIIPDMLSDLVAESKGSWAKQFVSPFVSAADQVADRLGRLRKQAARAAKDTAKQAKKAAAAASGGGGGSNVRKRAEWAGERYKTVRKGRLAGIPKPLAKQMRDVYKNQVKGKRSWASYVKRARNYGENARGKKGVWYEDTAVAKMASSGTVLSDGLIYAHKGEDVVPAKTSQPYSGGSRNSKKEVHYHQEKTILKLDAEETRKFMRGEAVDVVDEKESEKSESLNNANTDSTDDVSLF